MKVELKIDVELTRELSDEQLSTLLAKVRNAVVASIGKEVNVKLLTLNPVYVDPSHGRMISWG